MCVRGLNVCVWVCMKRVCVCVVRDVIPDPVFSPHPPCCVFVTLLKAFF